jgi:glycosyltransferase involved in cell wall biosynthesis
MDFNSLFFAVEYHSPKTFLKKMVRMKIGYLANIRLPSERAHSVQIVHMCRAFSETGTELALFANTRSRAVLQEIQNYYQIPLTFKIKRLSHGLFLPKILPAYYASEFFFALNFLVHRYANDFDILYSRQEWVLWILSLFLHPSKLVWESHEAKLNFPARKLLKKGIKTVAISEGIFEDYTKFGIAKENLLVAHDGIDESFFESVETKGEARKRLGIPADKTVAMYIGGFDGWKGIEIFFAAASFASGVLFVAVGGSKEQVALFSQKYPNVLFLGQLPYMDLRNNQQAADVLVIPNSGKTELSARYTSPLKLFAHMASGVPIIASDIPSLTTVTGRELVTLVVPDSPEALVGGIQTVFAHYDQKMQLAQELKRVSVGYTWTERAKKIIHFCK